MSMADEKKVTAATKMPESEAAGTVLIADSGSTKTDWALMTPEGNIQIPEGNTKSPESNNQTPNGIAQTSDETAQTPGSEPVVFHTSGINPVQMTQAQMAEAVEELRTLLPANIHVNAVYFYGAGCIKGPAQQKVKETLRNVLLPHLIYNKESSNSTEQHLIYNKEKSNDTEQHLIYNKEESNDTDQHLIYNKEDTDESMINVESDMVGAARALCQREEGIACILGTGSNSCLWDGKRIVSNTPPLGYVLGDEGSGAYIGRMLVANILKGLTSRRIRDMFYNETGLTQDTVIEHVYRMPLANRWLAGQMEFVKRHKNEAEMTALVAGAFDAFLERNVMQYRQPSLPLNFTGSVAETYQNILRQCIERRGWKMGVVVRRPIDGLIRYHRGS